MPEPEKQPAVVNTSETAAPVYTGLALIAVPPARPKEPPYRHVTPDRQTTLCGLDVPGEWYAGDAGVFGETGDCERCLAEVRTV